MKKVLVFAPHPDDEIIGVGGTIIKEIENKNEVYICIVTKGTTPLFSDEQTLITRNETLSCHTLLGVKKTFFLDFPAVMLEEEHRYEINEKILAILAEVSPDEVYIPHYGDMQKDHQIVTDSCMVALRPKYSSSPKRIFIYETLSETGWNIPNINNEFIPNRFVDISIFLEKKLNALNIYKSQLSVFPNARSIESVTALAKFRGTLMNMQAAEAFMVVREIE